MLTSFDQRKASVMKDLYSGVSDKSPKGSIDAPILDMCCFLNEQNDIYTTSSCSGRVSMLKNGALNKSGEWLVASHYEVTETQVFDALVAHLTEDEAKLLDGFTSETKNDGASTTSTYTPIKSQSPNAINLESSTCDIYFRFEAFVLAVETRSLEVASAFLTIAHQCGYRESGVTAVAKRYIVNVRGSIRLDVPVVLDSKLLVSPEYIQILVRIANEKMRQNISKIDKFYSMLKEGISSLQVQKKAQIEVGNENSIASSLTCPKSRFALVSGASLCVPRNQIKKWKDVLKSAGCLDKRAVIPQTSSASLSSALASEYGVEFSSEMVDPLYTSNNSLIPLKHGLLPYLQESPWALIPVSDITSFLHAVVYTHQDLTSLSSSDYTPLLLGSALSSLCLGVEETFKIEEGPLVVSTNVANLAILNNKLETNQNTEKNTIKQNKSEPSSYLSISESPCIYNYLDMHQNDITNMYLLLDKKDIKVAKDKLKEKGLMAPRTAMVKFNTTLPYAASTLFQCSQEPSLQHIHGYLNDSQVNEGAFLIPLITESCLSELRTHSHSHNINNTTNSYHTTSSTCTNLQMSDSCYNDVILLKTPDVWECSSLSMVVTFLSPSKDNKNTPPLNSSQQNNLNTQHNGVVLNGSPHSIAYAFTQIIYDAYSPHFNTTLSTNTSTHTDSYSHSHSDLKTPISFDNLLSEMNVICPKKWELLGGCVLLTSHQQQHPFFQHILQHDSYTHELSHSSSKQHNSSHILDNTTTFTISPTLSHIIDLTPSGLISLDTLCEAICQQLQASVVAVQCIIDIDLMRSPQTRIIYKQPGLLPEHLVTKTQKSHKTKKNSQSTSIDLNSKPDEKKFNLDSLDSKFTMDGGGLDPTGCWVKHRENGIWYVLNVARSMFSSGNTTEKARAGLYSTLYPLQNENQSLRTKRGERVLDLYSGIGYFTIPMLTHGKAEHVFGCEMNPYSNTAILHAVKYNAQFHSKKNVQQKQLDHVEKSDLQSSPTQTYESSLYNKLSLIPGDNRRSVVALMVRNSVDRISLGLIPSSIDSWATALIALQPRGGMLHVHMNVPKGEEDDWAKNTLVPALYERIQLLSILDDVSLEEISKNYEETESGHYSLAGIDDQGCNENGDYIFSLKNASKSLQKLDISSIENNDQCKYSTALYSMYARFANPSPTNNKIPLGSGPIWDSRKNNWNITVKHVEIVKSYGPKLMHIVVDVFIQ